MAAHKVWSEWVQDLCSIERQKAELEECDSIKYQYDKGRPCCCVTIVAR